MSCPICARETHKSYRPFCSKRCADVDLGRWLTEGYRAPVEDDDPDATPSTEAPERPH